MKRLLAVTMLGVLLSGCMGYRSPSGEMLIRFGLDLTAKKVDFVGATATQPAHCVITDLSDKIDPALAAALVQAGQDIGEAKAAAAVLSAKK